MAHELDHYDGRQLLVRLTRLFNSGDAFQVTNLHFVFVCGGTSPSCMRSQFLKWVGPEFPSLVPILAEAAFQKTQLVEPSEFPNLSRFEKLIADVADCVVIFPESAGSYAELGLFSNLREIRKKILVVNELRFQASNSFLQLGPIDEINTKSRFRPALHLDPNAAPLDFGPVKTTLVERLKSRGHRKRVSPLKYNDLDMQQKLVISHEIVRLFGKVSMEAVIECFRVIFGDVNPNQIRRSVSLLLAIKKLEYEDQMLTILDHHTSYLEYEGQDPEEFVAAATIFLTRQGKVMRF
jgi:hypothetical protein